MENLVSDTYGSYVRKRYNCAEEGCEKGQKREGTIAGFLEHFLIENDTKSIQTIIKKMITKKHGM